MELWVWLLIGFAAGFTFGYGISVLLRSRTYVGTLREDHSDPEEAPYLFLELEAGGLEKIHKNKLVTLRVVIKDYISRK